LNEAIKIYCMDQRDHIEQLPIEEYVGLFSTTSEKGLPRYAGQKLRCASLMMSGGPESQSVIYETYFSMHLDEQGRWDKQEKAVYRNQLFRKDQAKTEPSLEGNLETELGPTWQPTESERKKLKDYALEISS
jgi:hypothetical protein